MDLAELQGSIDVPANSSPVWDDALHLAQLYDLIYTLPKPTIAAVQGAAVAGGAGLVTVCDLAVAVPEAKFGYPEVRRGLVAAMVMPHLLRHVGERMARYLLLSGEMIDAEASVRAGLVNEVLPASQLMDRALALAAPVPRAARRRWRAPRNSSRNSRSRRCRSNRPPRAAPPRGSPRNAVRDCVRSSPSSRRRGPAALEDRLPHWAATTRSKPSCRCRNGPSRVTSPVPSRRGGGAARPDRGIGSRSNPPGARE